jgi:mono/diheme cytochrome c family protein
VKRSSQIVAAAVVVLALAVLVVALVAGGDDDDTTAPAAGSEATAAAPSEAAIALFSQNCGECHTLTVAGTTGDVGPDLDDMAFDTERVLNAIENGAGGGAMAPNILAGADARAVAKLIATDEPTLAPSTAETESDGSHK